VDKKLIAARLASHGLLSQTDPISAVRNTIGIQAQAQNQADLNIFLRTGCTQDDLTQLYQAKKLVKTWANRWTLHLFTPEDWVLVIAARQNEKIPTSYHQDREAWCYRGAELLSEVLVRKNDLTLPEIRQILEADMPDFFGVKSGTYLLYSTLQIMAQRGQMILDPLSPREYHIFRSPDIPLPSEKDALLQLIPRFQKTFLTHDVDDFCKWLGIRKSTVKPLWEPVKFDNMSAHSDKLILAARFDSLLTGYLDKTWLTPSEHVNDMWTKNGILQAPIIFEDQLAGYWTNKIKGDAIIFETHLWDSVDSPSLSHKFDTLAHFLKKKRLT
jgi:hypothetical protein